MIILVLFNGWEVLLFIEEQSTKIENTMLDYFVDIMNGAQDSGCTSTHGVPLS